MKFTLNWLKDHLDTTASLQEICDMLTAIGLEVESVTDHSEALKIFTVAKILEAEQHPNADKLRVCKVQTKDGEQQIVCGAPNARAGIYVALASVGTTIPTNGMKIKKSKIRDVESNGMLCSADELGIGEDSAGIIELPEAAIGTPITEVLGLDDPVIDIAITPNRADALGVHGIARDLAAAGLGTLKKLPDVGAFKGNFASPIHVSIDTQSCQQFIGCTIKGVENTPSPVWMQQRLKAIGLRPISALVDITNYMSYDLGRPLHVYDSAKLSGNLQVRQAKAGETIKALDEKSYTLNPDIAVIADDKSPVAIAGIIGGMESGCCDTTQEVFLEVALFEPTKVAKSGRTLQIESDARYRFERGVDVNFVETGALHAIRMITELCGGEASELVRAGSTPAWQRTILLRPERVASLGGVEVAQDKLTTILEALGFTMRPHSNGLEVSPPSWRADIEGEADLIEEILRIHGYEHIPATPLPEPSRLAEPALSLAQTRVHLVRRQLASQGYLECCSWAFMAEEKAALFQQTNGALKLKNPISSDLDIMRPTLVPNLLDTARNNIFRGFFDLKLFEVGLQFSDTSVQGQQMVATGIRTGAAMDYRYKDNNYQRTGRPLNAFDAKRDALEVLQTLGMDKFDITDNTPSWYHPGRSGALTLGGKIILGYFGELHPKLMPAFDMSENNANRVVLFELFLDALPQPRKKTRAKPALVLSDYQAVERDFAFIVDQNISAADIIKTLTKAEKQLVQQVELFDVYGETDKPGDKKSVAVRVTLQAPDRTLSEEEITRVSDNIIAAAETGFGGQLRK